MVSRLGRPQISVCLLFVIRFESCPSYFHFFFWNLSRPSQVSTDPHARPTTSLLLRSSIIYMLKWNFPICVGAIDGKLIRVECHANSGSMFYNYKDSIVLQALADAQYKFISIEVRAYGRQHDDGIFPICYQAQNYH